VVRSNFRESGPMAAFIEKEMPGALLEESEFSSGRWTDKLQDLLSLNRVPRPGTNGAENIGRYICDRFL
jgi:hypothetical protein